MIDKYDLPTGTYDPPGDSKLVFLGGAITYYWNERWDTQERIDYHAWRKEVRYALIEAGYVTYAPHEALKGPWNPKCQLINDLGIATSDAFLVLSEPWIPSKGTAREVGVAEAHGVPVLFTPQSKGLSFLLDAIQEHLWLPTAAQ